MFSVLVMTQSAVSAWFWGALIVAAISGSALASWIGQAWTRPILRRYVVAFIVALVIVFGYAQTSYAVAIGPCKWEDYWWLWFC